MFYIQQKDKFFKDIAKATAKLIIAGFFIGLLHEHDLWVALILAFYIAIKFYINLFKTETKNWMLLIGMILTGAAGVLGEYWGVSNSYWAYHDLSGGREFPYWLPFAWMLAFHFMYKLESQLIVTMTSKTLLSKIILTFIIAMIFPALGEVITIALGVWTYYWPMQFLGVPLYAVICLVVLHMTVNYIMTIICKKYNIKDALFYID